MDGSVAVAVASILAKPSDVSFTFDPTEYGLSGGGRIFRIDEDGREPIGTYRGATPVRWDLTPGGAVVLEFRPG